MEINNKINTLKRLKDAIINFLNKNIHYDKILLYNNKAILLDDADIEYITNDQILYISLDGNKKFYILKAQNSLTSTMPINTNS
jgi:hypothetical protein